MRAVDFERFKPVIVRFEHEHLADDDHDATLELLIGHGYRIALEEHDTLAYLGADGVADGAGAVEGPSRLQAEHDRLAAEQRDFYEERIRLLTAEVQSLNEKVAEAGEWAHGMIAEVNAAREREVAAANAQAEQRLAEQRAFFEQTLGAVTVERDAAMRRVADLGG